MADRAVPRVVILTPGVGGLGGISRIMDAVDEELQRQPRPVEVRLVSTRGDVALLRPLVFLSAILRVGLACLFGRCDVLHVNLASRGSTYRKLALSAIARRCGVPTVIHLHGGGYDAFWAAAGPAMRRRIGRLFGDAARILVLGGIWRDLVAREVPGAAGRILVLPNASRRVPLAAPSPRGADRLILFLGRLDGRKGVPTLIGALEALASVSGWRAVLAGDGEVEKTRDEIEAKGLAGRVSVPGWLGPEAVEQLWREADVFVLPSVAENLPLSIIEAFAHGVPVVATPVGAVPEVIEDGRTGLLVPVGDAESLAAALRRLVVDASLRAALAEAAHRTFEQRFELASYVDRLAEVWIDAAKQRGVEADQHPRTRSRSA